MTWGDGVSSVGARLLFMPQVRGTAGLSANDSPVPVTLSQFFSRMHGDGGLQGGCLERPENTVSFSL